MTPPPTGRPADEGLTEDGALLGVLERSRSLGFLGPGSLRVQVAHARGFAVGVPRPPGRLLDLGSGGGVPGLVLAAHWPTTEVVLLDAAERRCAFLAESVASLGWDERVRVVRARAEDAGRREDLRARFDVVVARGFGPPPVTAECGAPFLVVGGRLIVSEPPPVDDGAACATPQVAGGGACGLPASGPAGGDGADDTVRSSAGARAGDGDPRGRETARAHDRQDRDSASADAAPGAAAAGSDASVRWPAEGLALVGLRSERVWSDPFRYRSLVLERTCPDRFPRRTGVPAKRPLF
jgi:hypothetical protein